MCNLIRRPIHRIARLNPCNRLDSGTELNDIVQFTARLSQRPG
ncbi:hypothetical protein [Azospirillum argentinense]